MRAAGPGARSPQPPRRRSALLGAILGTAGAYLALVAWHWRDLGYLGHPPYLDLAALLVGLPIIALIGGWLFGRAPADIARRPLE